jgi:glycosyltransferase involved in cell wall biosynthesis
MRVLMVSSGNNQWIYGISAFVYEQTLALREEGIEVEVFPVLGEGIIGYFKAAVKLNRLLKTKKFDIIHAHYVLSALVTIFQVKVPVIVTFIGSDIYNPKLRLLARLMVFRTAKSIIFVTEKLQKLSKCHSKSLVIQYGLDLTRFFTIDKKEARNHLQWSENKHYIFFASKFDRIEKNAQLAFDALEILKQEGFECKLIEFNKIKPEDLNFYYNASDLFLLTSVYEGSPQSLKEAMACNCPIVSTNVGDVEWVIGNTEGCNITSFDPSDLARKIKMALDYGKPTNGRKRILELGLDSKTIAKEIQAVYYNVLNMQ